MRCAYTHPSSVRRLRADELIGLTIVTLVVVEGFVQLFGLRDPLSLVALAVGCASYSAQRLLHVRRVGTAAVKAADIHAVMAATPFLLLPALHRLAPASAIWHPAMPPATRYVGMALAVAVAMWRTGGGVFSTRRFLLLMISVFLITSSAAVALLMLYAVAAGMLERSRAIAVRCAAPVVPVRRWIARFQPSASNLQPSGAR